MVEIVKAPGVEEGEMWKRKKRKEAKEKKGRKGEIDAKRGVNGRGRRGPGDHRTGRSDIMGNKEMKWRIKKPIN